VDTTQSAVAKKYKAMFYEGATFDDVNKPDADFVQSDQYGPKLKFIPASTKKRYFWYNRTLFIVQREVDHLAGPTQNSNQRPEDESIDIWTVGRNPGTLRKFLAECRLKYMKEQEHKTVIHTTDMYDMNWSAAQTRPLRTLDSVIMQARDKNRLLADIIDYLKPETKAWYESQGIPYRRGYLLYGLPGTGKTSLTMALAGTLNCQLYILSLAAQNLHDNYLQELFMTLPPKAIVLLEDVDSANVDRDYGYGQPESDIDSDDENEVDKVLNANRRGSRRPSNISLSGLLNALDGIGAQEGRILIMTTNRRESLDAALIRPGRVDMEIEFGKANFEVLEQIFIQLYIHKAVSIAPSSHTSEDVSEKPSPLELLDQEEHDQKIHQLAKEFASMVPENMFTPAEIQNYLLPRKKEYQRAIADLPGWLEDQMADLRRQEAKAKKARQRALNRRKKWMKQRKDLKLDDIFEDGDSAPFNASSSLLTLEAPQASAPAPATDVLDGTSQKDAKTQQESTAATGDVVPDTKEDGIVVDKALEAVKAMEGTIPSSASVNSDSSSSNGQKSVDGDWSDLGASRPESVNA